MELQIPTPPQTIDRNPAVALSTTAATPVVTVTVRETGLYWVTPYCINTSGAAVDLTLTLAWTDPVAGAAETYTWSNAAPVQAGPTTFPGQTILAEGGTTITVTATAATAGALTVGAAVVALL